MVDPTEGAAAVRWARTAIARAVQRAELRSAGPGPTSAVFDEPRGVFVTLKRHRDGALRGCIGFARPVYPLRVAVQQAAVAAALEDPRFPPLTEPELTSTRIEVSVLTPPVRIASADPEALVAAVQVGRDGLIAESDGASGLLLPQVAVEQGWDPSTFLAETCVKAGLPADAWRSGRVRFQRFGAEVFAERSPGGEVVRHSVD